MSVTEIGKIEKATPDEAVTHARDRADLMRRLLVALVLTSCGGGSGAQDARESAVRARMARVHEAACLRPAERRDCEEGARIEFTGRTYPVRIGEPPLAEPSGAVWCENGVTRGRFVGFQDDSKGAPIEGVVGQAVWEAMWRVVDATDACISAFDAPVTVTRDGKQRRCASPQLDMRSPVERAYGWAHRKVPRIVKRRPRNPDAICELDPGACPFVAPGSGSGPGCPEYDGDE